jgi:hypothetical protein
MSTMTDEGTTYGPALSGLTDKQRTFVWAMATVRTPDGKRIKRSHAARLAGYMTGENGGNPERRRRALDQTAWRLLQDQKIVAAIREVAGREIEGEAIASAQFLASVRDNEDAPLMARLRAADSLLDRGGLAGLQKIAVDHIHRDMTGEALMERIRTLAKKHGLDVEQLMKGEGPQARTIEAKALPSRE